MLEIRFSNIAETNLKTGITAILENNELSTKEKVDSLIEFIEIEAQTERVDELETLTDELEERVDELKSDILKLDRTILDLRNEVKELQDEIDEK